MLIQRRVKPFQGLVTSGFLFFVRGSSIRAIIIISTINLHIFYTHTREGSGFYIHPEQKEPINKLVVNITLQNLHFTVEKMSEVLLVTFSYAISLLTVFPKHEGSSYREERVYLCV